MQEINKNLLFVIEPFIIYPAFQKVLYIASARSEARMIPLKNKLHREFQNAFGKVYQ